MTPFKLNWTNSIDNINELEKEIETTVKDLNDKIDLLEQENEQLEQLVEQMQEVEEKSLTITENGTTNITPSTGKYAMTKVTVTTNIPSPTISDCRELFKDNKRISELSNLIPICKPTNAYRMFMNSTDLTSSALPSLDVSLVTDATQIFYGCNNSNFTTVPNMNFASLTGNTNEMFKNCTKLTNLSNVTFSADLTGIVGMFQNCSYLTGVPTFLGTTNFNNLSYAFSNCYSLVNLPYYDFSGITAFKDKITAYVENCSSLSNDSIQNVLKSLLTILPNDTATSTYKTLRYVGITYAQKDIATSFPEWTTLASRGWVVGW